MTTRLAPSWSAARSSYPSGCCREYARYEAGKPVTTNTVENVFSVLKRGMKGVYQHCGEAHLHRYLAEFAFRYNRCTALGFSDKERVDAIMEGIDGKRLTYRRTDEAPHH